MCVNTSHAGGPGRPSPACHVTWDNGAIQTPEEQRDFPAEAHLVVLLLVAFPQILWARTFCLYQLSSALATWENGPDRFPKLRTRWHPTWLSSMQRGCCAKTGWPSRGWCRGLWRGLLYRWWHPGLGAALIRHTANKRSS